MEHRAFVRGVVRRLIPDEHQVDDIVQETWLTALRSPPQKAGSLRAWLARVGKNLAISTLRRQKRRQHRERQAARRERTPAAVDLVSRLEHHRLVVEAVLELDEPLRTTVLLRFYEELPPREIAALQDVPVATVRSRLRRAIVRMRRHFDETHGGDRAAWCLALAPLAWPIAPVAPFAPVAPHTYRQAITAAAMGCKAGDRRRTIPGVFRRDLLTDPTDPTDPTGPTGLTGLTGQERIEPAWGGSSAETVVEGSKETNPVSASENAPGVRRIPFRATVLAAAAILAAVGLCYFGARDHDFAYDDHSLITGNDYLKAWMAGAPDPRGRPVDYVSEMLTADFAELAQRFGSVAKDPPLNYYRPVIALSYLVDTCFFATIPAWTGGPPEAVAELEWSAIQAGGFRLTNLLFHALNSLLVYFLMLALVRRYRARARGRNPLCRASHTHRERDLDRRPHRRHRRHVFFGGVLGLRPPPPTAHGRRWRPP